MTNVARPKLTGLLLELDGKLSPFGFKKIDSPSLYADLMGYLTHINFIDDEEPEAFNAKDHIWVRVEKDEHGTIHHSMYVIPYDVSVDPRSPIINYFARISPNEGGGIEDASVFSRTRQYHIGEVLSFPDAALVSALEPNGEAPKEQAKPAAHENDVVPVRPGEQPAASMPSRALKALRSALSYFSRKP